LLASIPFEVFDLGFVYEVKARSKNEERKIEANSLFYKGWQQRHPYN
jgi:metal-sulfur cluster biosynthetic enzyme